MKILLFISLREPNATKLEKEGLGYVVSSIGELSGEMPYTAFYARKSYINENKDVINSFNKAINEGLEFVKNSGDREVAEAIIKQFTDISLDDLITIVKRYREADSWLDNTTIEENIYVNLEDVMINNDLLKDYVPFTKLVMNLNE